VICQVVFVNSAFLSVSDDALPAHEIGRYKWSVIRLAEWSIGLTVWLCGFSLPLLCLTGTAYAGLSAGHWFLTGLIFAALTLLVVAIVCWFLNDSLLKKGVCVLPEREERLYPHNHALRRKCTVGLVVTLAVTLALHAFGHEMIWSAHNLARGTTFHDYESFIAHMEKDVRHDPTIYQSGWFTIAEDHPVAPESSAIQEVPTGESRYYDEYGNEISEEEALTRTLKDKNGNVVCTYIERNETAVSIRYSPGDGTVLPITVISDKELWLARQQNELITYALFVLYPIEALAALLLYLKKRVK